jgi:hypothetical protein
MLIDIKHNFDGRTEVKTTENKLKISIWTHANTTVGSTGYITLISMTFTFLLLLFQEETGKRQS